MTAPTDRLAQNRTIFRSVNEHVREMSLRQDIVPWTVRTEFFCECASPECLETIELTLTEFEAVRAEEGTFVVCPGHVTSSLTVVEAADRYLIVERREPWR